MTERGRYCENNMDVTQYTASHQKKTHVCFKPCHMVVVHGKIAELFKTSKVFNLLMKIGGATSKF